MKNGTECVYDAAPQKDTESRSSISKNGHGVKRRRESSRPIEEDIDDIQSIYGHLKQSGASEQRSQAIEARLDKLTSMIERLSKTNQPPDVAGKQRLAPNVKLEPAEGDPRLSNIAALKPTAGSRPDSPRRAAESSGDEFPIPAGHATDLVDPVGSLNLGHLSLEDGGRSRYGFVLWSGGLYIDNGLDTSGRLIGLIFLMRYAEEVSSLSLKDYAKYH